ncbi:uncharacterized protein LOC141729794 [Zonotrichia albicollis]|uniref:uncharacterized protein LOC141729793 n=1 Tax=Zonotrichia albicollis TaxID=44394 RepID=UPI003D80B85F
MVLPGAIKVSGFSLREASPACGVSFGLRLREAAAVAAFAGLQGGRAAAWEGACGGRGPGRNVAARERRWHGPGSCRGARGIWRGRAGQGRQRRRGRCCGGPGGAGRSVRSGRGARAPPPPPGPVPAPPGRGSGRGSPGRRRPRVPEEPPEEPLSWREPRSVRGRQRARPSAARSAGAVPRFGGAFSALIASLCSVGSGCTLRAAVFFLSGAGGDDKGWRRQFPVLRAAVSMVSTCQKGFPVVPSLLSMVSRWRRQFPVLPAAVSMVSTCQKGLRGRPVPSLYGYKMAETISGPPSCRLYGFNVPEGFIRSSRPFSLWFQEGGDNFQSSQLPSLWFQRARRVYPVVFIWLEAGVLF